MGDKLVCREDLNIYHATSLLDSLEADVVVIAGGDEYIHHWCHMVFRNREIELEFYDRLQEYQPSKIGSWKSHPRMLVLLARQELESIFRNMGDIEFFNMGGNIDSDLLFG